MERVLAFSVRHRWLVLLLTLAAAISGAWSLTKLPIDAVPDVTNVQVQINAIAPSLSPIEIEMQVTFALETALAGTPGLESTRSFSRNGFAQVTAVFTEKTDIYFARQQVTERLAEAKASLIQPAIVFISVCFMPRVVSAGVPMRMPLGSSGGRSSKGILFLFTVMPA